MSKVRLICSQESSLGQRRQKIDTQCSRLSLQVRAQARVHCRQGLAIRSSEADVQLLEEGRVKSDTITTAGRGRVDYGCKL